MAPRQGELGQLGPSPGIRERVYHAGHAPKNLAGADVGGSRLGLVIERLVIPCELLVGPGGHPYADLAMGKLKRRE
jgi:hypothetical protein